jgi:hypothetical protein
VGDDLGEESKGDQRAGHCAHVDGGPSGHLADVGAAGGLEHELLGGQGADERLLACLLLHADTPVVWVAFRESCAPRLVSDTSQDGFLEAVLMG